MNHVPRNPTALLNIGSDPALCRLLRACGVEEACISGEASDYDTFLALASALSLCEGHPLRDEMNSALIQATGISVPLCVHTARAHWEAWVKIYHYGGQVTAAALPAVCPYCAPASPHVIRKTDCRPLPDPFALRASEITAWSQALEAALVTNAHHFLYALPGDYSFTRPDPYHANLAVGKLYSGEPLTYGERNLLITQALRVWGLALVRGGMPSLLQGGKPEAVTALLAYLATSNALPRMVWLPHVPTYAEAVSGLYPEVGTGYAVTEGESGEAAEKKKAAYAMIAPIGRATVLIP